jgi:hypothetical protein
MSGWTIWTADRAMMSLKAQRVYLPRSRATCEMISSVGCSQPIPDASSQSVHASGGGVGEEETVQPLPSGDRHGAQHLQVEQRVQVITCEKTGVFVS